VFRSGVLVTLERSGYGGDGDDEVLAMRESSLGDRLSGRLRRDGYLYLPGFLTGVWSATARLRDALHGVGWLARPDRLDLATEPRPRFTADSFREVYPTVQRVEEFHSLAHDSRLLELMESLLDGPVFCHPAKAARLAARTSPDEEFSTRPHQDFVRLHVASDVLTAWVCLADCSAERQGLRVLAGSHLAGFLPTRSAPGSARPLYVPVAENDPDWCGADFRVGDVVVFHSLTIHCGGPNRTDTLRLSADFRYQRRTDTMRTEWAHPHGWPNTPDWPEITTGWTSEEWVALPPEVVLVPMPDVDYGTYLATLSAPYSALLGS